jgi:hypothetical protein
MQRIPGMKLALALALLTPLWAEPAARLEAQRAAKDFPLTLDLKAWRTARPVAAAVDPFGKPAGPGGQFEIRTLWTPQYLYFLFSCPYDSLYLKPNPVTKTETNKLWEWDVAEVFVGGDPANIYHYRELQVSPQGEWVDLDIDRKNPKPEGGWKWDSGFESAAKIDASKKIWYGAMKIPFAAIHGQAAQPGQEFPINIYRLTGAPPTRKSTMWTPVHQRSHHTPEQFGRMVLGR